MELNGAFSNPFERDNSLLKRLVELQRRLLGSASSHPREPRRRAPRVKPMHETISRVLEQAGRPMRTNEIHESVEQLHGHTVLRTTLKAALADGTAASQPRFRRVRYGVYELAG